MRKLKPVDDWSRWTQMPSIPLWMAVALSCNIEPMTIPLEVMRADAEVFGGFSVFLTEYKKRRRIADAHAQPGGALPLHKHLEDVAESQVVLVDFRTFGETLEPPWTFPEGFPRAVPPSTHVLLGSVGSVTEGLAAQAEHDNDDASGSRRLETREERQRRRFDRYRELGGIRVAQDGGGWRVGGTRGALAALAREEAAAGRPWNNARDVARELDDEAERRRADRAMPRG